jgi:hypothetical protein
VLHAFVLTLICYIFFKGTQHNRDYRTWSINWFIRTVLQTRLPELFSSLPWPAGPWCFPVGSGGWLPACKVTNAPRLVTTYKRDLRFSPRWKCWCRSYGL